VIRLALHRLQAKSSTLCEYSQPLAFLPVRQRTPAPGRGILSPRRPVKKTCAIAGTAVFRGLLSANRRCRPVKRAAFPLFYPLACRDVRFDFRSPVPVWAGKIPGDATSGQSDPPGFNHIDKIVWLQGPVCRR